MWLVQLNGSDFDIGNIGRQMPNGLPYKIIEVDGYFYLTGEVLDKEESSLDVFRHAQRVIDRLNLASKLLDISHQTVSVEAVRDGEGIRHFHREGHGDSRTSGIAVGQVYTSDGAPLPQERTWFELISDLEQIEELKPVIDEVRALLDGDCNESQQYDIWEIICHHVGNKKAFLKIFTRTRDELSRFTSSTNQKRHARPSEPPPEIPMSQTESLSFIEEIFRQWIRYQALKHGINLSEQNIDQ